MNFDAFDASVDGTMLFLARVFVRVCGFGVTGRL
jgi:hypothetical protein